MFQIKIFEEKYASQTAELVLQIQQIEFQVPITLAEQPDLQHVAQFFQKGKGNFWVAVAPDDQVVGTVGMIDCGGDLACLRKMFVRSDFRGREFGVAQKLLESFEQWAAENGFEKIQLGTIERLAAAIKFYRRNGFERILPDDLPPNFPRMAVDTHFFEKILGKN